MKSRGFTLVELMISLGMLGIVAAAIGSVFTTGLRTYTHQIELAHVRANLRQAMATFTRELRGLDAGDSSGSDIAEMAESSLTYRAHRSTYFLCTPPDVATLTLTVWEHPSAEIRRIDPERDSILIFAENKVGTADDNVWLTAGLRSVTNYGLCPGGIRGTRLALTGLSFADLEGVNRGAVVRGYQLTKILLYPDATGRSWVGLREWRPGSGWTITQPILGPVARKGLRFSYFDAGGGLASKPNDVARIVVSVVAVDNRLAASTADSKTQVTDSLEIHVGLRNNPRGG